jgi:hypothetical protein
MGYGLNIINDNKQIIIDSNYKNYFLFEENTISFTNNNTLSSYYRAFNNQYLTPPIVSFKNNTSVSVGVSSYVKSGNYYVGMYVFCQVNATANFSYRVYNLKKSVSVDQFGLRIFDNNSNIIYDSGAKPLVIRQQIDVSIGTSSSTVTHSNYDNAYYIVSSVGFGAVGRGNPQGPLYFFKIGIQKLSNTQVIVGYIMHTVKVTNFTDSIFSTNSCSLLICE